MKTWEAWRPIGPQYWWNNLPQIAKRFELGLFKSAPDFESYNNPNTLKQRLQKMGQDMQDFHYGPERMKMEKKM